jgi:hypothetical protein
MRNEISLDALKLFGRSYSDDDVKFITKVAEAKA